jgi:hypothetical protein
MPVGFIGLIQCFANYREDMKQKKMKNYKFLKGFADGTRVPFPPWWAIDLVSNVCF